VEWILKLAAARDEGPWVDIMEISNPDDLGDIANLGLTLTEAKQLLARVQREISAAQAKGVCHPSRQGWLAGGTPGELLSDPGGERCNAVHRV
jgi:hypothetical protein